MKNRFYINLFVIVVGLALIFWLANTGINRFQDQIERRDTLISLYAEQQDSLRKSNSDLIESLNKLFIGANIKNDGSFDVKKFIDNHNNLVDSIKDLKWQLDFIKKNYGIYVIQKETNNNKSITIKGGEKLDSALLLLPRFRDRLVRVDKNTWTVDKAGEEMKSIAAQYNKEINDYNNLNKKYNELAIKHNADVKKYRDILRKIADKGLIKIDTLADGYEYHF